MRLQNHHIISRSKLKAEIKDKAHLRRVLKDPRNELWISKGVHDNHTLKARKIALEDLPSAVFEFGVEVIGAGKTYNYLRREYAGGDPRLDNLLGDH